MQRAEVRGPIAFAAGVTDDRALHGFPSLDLKPRVASFSGGVDAVALLGHDTFEAHLFYCFEECRSFIDRFAYAIRGILSNRVLKPLTPSRQRFADNRPSI